MTVKELKSIIDRFDDEDTINVNVTDSKHITEVTALSIHFNTDIKGKLVIKADLPIWCYIGERL